MLPEHIDTGEIEAGAEHADDESTDQRADDRAASAEERGAADHHSGDRIEIALEEALRAHRTDPAHRHPAGKGAKGAGGRIDRKQHLFGIDAGHGRRLAVIADGIDMAAPAGPVEHVPEDQDEDEHHHRAGGELRAGYGEGATEELEQRRFDIDVLTADRLAAGKPQDQREEDFPGTERDDEGRQAEDRHKSAIDETGDEAADDADGDGNECRQTDMDAELPHDHCRQHHHRRHRKVDAGGEDHQRLGDAENTDDGDLLDDQSEIERREEIVGDHTEDQRTRDQHEHRHDGRVGMKEVLQLLQGAALGLLELCDFRGAAVEDLFEVLHFATTGSFTIRHRSFSPLNIRLRSFGPGPCPYDDPVNGYGKGGRQRARPPCPSRPVPGRSALRISCRQRLFWSAPALGQRFLGGDRGDAVDRLVGHEFDAGVEEVEAFAGAGLLATIGEGLDRFHTHGRHQQRELHGGGTDDAFLDVLHTGATAIDRDDQRLVGEAESVECLIGTGSGGLVDGVDDIDALVALQQVLHRPAAALFGTVGGIVADDPRIVLVAHHAHILDVHAEALEEALIAQDVDADLRLVEVEQGDLRVSGGIAHLGGGPLADQIAGHEIVGGEGGIGGVDGIERGVEGDHQKTSVTRLLDGRDDTGGIGRGDEDALGTGGNEALDGLDLGLVVAVIFAGIGAQLHAELGGLGLGTFFHLDEEGVGVGLGDQADDHVLGRGHTGGGDGQRQGGDSGIEKTSAHCGVNLPVQPTCSGMAAADASMEAKDSMLVN